MTIYNFLVNRHIGISYRYHLIHDNASSIRKIFSWIYLILLNIAYYFLFFRFLGKKPGKMNSDVKALNITESESLKYSDTTLKIEEMICNLEEKSDIISFDIFDTLIFRSVGIPTDVFLLMQEELGIPDFRNIRTWAEGDARGKCFARNGHYEVTLEEIWDAVYKDTGIDKKKGMDLEIATELKVCYANPFMKAVWDKLIEMGKEIIIVSDMYLPSDVLAQMLEKNGYTGYKKLYVSCEYGKNKAGGDLFEIVKKDFPGKKIIHVGDNPNSDHEQARKHGLEICPYTNVNKYVQMYRPFDMATLTGSAYRALVSNQLYNGLNTYSMEYEYGFIYGGLFALGYCNFIHEYVHKNAVDKILFLARDGEILKKVYEDTFPEDKGILEYAYWSRKPATKLMAVGDKHDFFRRFIYHKINQDYTIAEILHSMELDFLVDELGDWKEIWKSWAQELVVDSLSQARKDGKKCSEEELWNKMNKSFIDLHATDKLTEKNGYLLRKFIEAKWDRVLAAYEPQHKAAKKYYKDMLAGCKKVVAVDIGWAGSGALALDYLFNKVWNLDCEVIGLLAGTNTIHNAEPDATDAFLQSGKLVSYLYSPSHNRDLLKKHDPNKDYNVFWELLLSSPTPKFQGFKLLEDGSVGFEFGDYDKNIEGIKEIQRGILDFAHEYTLRFKDFPYMLNISGRDAYAPMLVAASHNEKYLRAIEKKFALEINVN